MQLRKIGLTLAMSSIATLVNFTYTENSFATTTVVPQSEASKNWWEIQRAVKDEALSRYLTQNEGNYADFRHTPAGIAGIPALVFRLFPPRFSGIVGNT